jgi:hypothetical protein
MAEAVMAMMRTFLISGLGCLRMSFVAMRCQSQGFSRQNAIFTFIAIAMWHLHIHEDQMERPSVLRRSLKRIDSLEAVEIRITLETQLRMAR